MLCHFTFKYNNMCVCMCCVCVFLQVIMFLWGWIALNFGKPEATCSPTSLGDRSYGANLLNRPWAMTDWSKVSARSWTVNINTSRFCDWCDLTLAVLSKNQSSMNPSIKSLKFHIKNQHSNSCGTHGIKCVHIYIYIYCTKYLHISNQKTSNIMINCGN